MDNPLDYIKSPPTDSLYKFMAISGILLMILTIISFQYVNYKILNKYLDIVKDSLEYNLKRENRNLNNDMFKSNQNVRDTLSKMVYNSKQYIDSVVNYYHILNKNSFKVKQKQNSIDDLNKYLFKLNSKVDSLFYLDIQFGNELECLANNMTIKRNENNYIKTKRDDYKTISFILICAFSLISVLGYYLWYHKIQKYQDKILLFEAQKNILTEEIHIKDKLIKRIINILLLVFGLLLGIFIAYLAKTINY
jgi:hypothetical protein